MGCRHAQSLLGHKEQYEVHIVEPSDDNIRVNSERIGAATNDFTRHLSLDDISGDFDLAIVATSSGPRYNVVKQLLHKGIKLFLLEKIVFQSAEQFTEIRQLMADQNARGYCNFVNRYFNAYNEVKEKLSGNLEPCTMTVYGGEFGVGCNSIHYIDIFQYINGRNKLVMNDCNLTLSDAENRRGKEYKEFTGSINISDSRKNTLTLISDKKFQGGVIINILAPNGQYILSEQTGQMFFLANNQTMVSDFTIVPTSKLTHTIAQEIFSGNCRLTQVAETAEAHGLLFDCFNKIVYNTTGEKLLCPIT